MKPVLISALLLIIFLFESCIKEKDFPPQPIIEFLEYVNYNKDSADCIIGFKDGDGDVGVFQGDTTKHLKMTYYFKHPTTGLFVPYDFIPSTPQLDTLFIPYIVPYLTPDGQNKSLEGEIKIKLRAAPLYHPSHKVVRFDIILRDRAGNYSNKVTTNEIVIN